MKGATIAGGGGRTETGPPFFTLPNQVSADYASIGGGIRNQIHLGAASTVIGGGFTLRGGFWSILAALPLESRPPIVVSLVNGIITVSWPLTAAGYLLDQTPTLSGTPIPWTQVPFPYQTNATRIFITVLAPSGTRFYQLRKPVQL